MADIKNIQDAVNEAAKEHGIENDPERGDSAADNTEEIIKEAKTSTGTESDKEDESSESEEETPVVDEETQQALEFWNKLKGPEGLKLIELMARRAGILNAETPKEKKEVVKTVIDELLEDTPVEFHDLVKVLGPAITKMVDGKVGQAKREFHEVIAKQQAEAFQNEYQKYVSEVKLTDAEAVELDKLTDKYPPNPNKPVSLADYLNPLLGIVRNEASKKQQLIATKQKQKANLQNRAGNIKGEASEETLSKNERAATARDAVEMALRELTQKG